MLIRWLLITVIFIFAINIQAEKEKLDNINPWDKIDIIPMPKEIKLTGKLLALGNNVKLVIGKNACTQSKIGADWINEKIIKLDGKPLNIIDNPVPQDNSIFIIIGTSDDNESIKNASANNVINLNNKEMGKRGYAIKISNDGKKIYLAGIDPIGTLYACVTFSELIEKQNNFIVWKEANVRDWPDVINMTMGDDFVCSNMYSPELIKFFKNVVGNKNPTEKVKQDYLKHIKEMYDRLLRWKITCAEYKLYSRGRKFMPQKWQQIIKEGIQYGKERGIGALLYAEHPFVGLAADYPELAKSDKILQPERGDGCEMWIRSWVLNDTRKKTAENLAKYIKAIGFTDVGFHDSDTGFFENPARWNDRSEASKKCWGDDYAAATVKKHKIYYDALKKEIPDIRIHFTFYPYQIQVLDLKSGENILAQRFGKSSTVKEMAKTYKVKYERFWKKLHDSLPEDATFCIRETTEAPVNNFRKITHGRGAFIWLALMSHAWRPVFSETPCWIGTFCDNQNDFIYIRYADSYVPLQSLAVREYSWNKNTPGAKTWNLLSPEEQWKHSESNGQIYDVVLPKIIRNIFCHEITADVNEAIRQNVAPHQIFKDNLLLRYDWMQDYNSIKQQADNAEKGAKALDQAWKNFKDSNLNLDEYAIRYLVYLREVFHASMWMAKIRSQNMLAKKLAMKNDLKGAEEAINTGLEYIKVGTEELKSLIAERPEDPVLRGKDYNNWSSRWRLYMADRTDFGKMEKILLQTKSELKEFITLGTIPKRILKKLSRRILRGCQTNEKIEVDGKLKEKSWTTAFPIESFLSFHKPGQVAKAFTCGKLLYDKDNIYLSFTCWLPGSNSIPDNDAVECFFNNAGLRKDYIHFIIKANGSVVQQYNKAEQAGGTTKWRKNNNWKCEGFKSAINKKNDFWTVEMKVPRKSINAKNMEWGWKANFCRAYPFNGEFDLSSTMPPGTKDFHDLKVFPSLYWAQQTGFLPEIEIQPVDLKIQKLTRKDATATSVSFRLSINSNLVLNNAVIEVTAYNKNGKLQSEKIIAEIPRIFYQWKSDKTFAIDYPEICNSGGLLVKLRTNEGESKRWIRFGGWKGANDIGSIFTNGIANKALNGCCFLPSMITVGGTQVDILNSKSGTVEFWIKPNRRGAWLPPYRKNEIRIGNNAVVHYGPFRKRYPRHTNNSPLAIYHSSSGNIIFSIFNNNHSGWISSANIRKNHRWNPKVWHHVACVWNGKNDKGSSMRIYLDGKKVTDLPKIVHKKRLKHGQMVAVENVKPYPIQIGSLNSDWLPADAVIDELRFSRTARYNENFVPDRKEFMLDKETSALFHFNENLIGHGIDSKGEKYRIDAIAGIANQ